MILTKEKVEQLKRDWYNNLFTHGKFEMIVSSHEELREENNKLLTTIKELQLEIDTNLEYV